MNARQLLISNPPHGDVDAARGGVPFRSHGRRGRDEDQLRPARDLVCGKRTRTAFLDTATAPWTRPVSRPFSLLGVTSSTIPPQSPAESFAFTDEGLQVDLATIGDGPWLTDCAGHRRVRPAASVEEQDVRGRPPARSLHSFRAGDGGSGDRARRCWPARARSLAVSRPLRALRDRARSESRSSRGSPISLLLPDNLPHGLSAMQNLVAEYENRFENAYVDRRPGRHDASGNCEGRDRGLNPEPSLKNGRASLIATRGAGGSAQLPCRRI